MAQLFNPSANFAIVAAEELVKRFTSLDYIVGLTMIAISGILGVYGAFKGGPQNTIRQLLAADGKLPPFLVSTSLMASFISASFILGNAAEIHQHGTMSLFSMASYFLVISVTAHIFLPLFYNSGAMTVFEYMELRFDRTLRYLTVFFFVVQMSLYISIQLYAPALALSKVTGMSLWAAVFVIGIVCTIYTSLGGIKAVVFTDTFQAAWMIVAMSIVVICGFYSQGGFAHAWEVARKGGRIRFDDLSVDPRVRHSVWGLVIGGFFTNLASYATNQMMVLRYFTISTETRAKMVVWGNLPYLAIIFTLSSVSGLMTFAYFSDCDPVVTAQIKNYDEILPLFVMAALGKHTPLPGVFASAIFAASLISISSAINALANVIFVDVISTIRPNIPTKTGALIITILGVVHKIHRWGPMSTGRQERRPESQWSGSSPSQKQFDSCVNSNASIRGSPRIVIVCKAHWMNFSARRSSQATNAVMSGIGGPVLGVLCVGAFLPVVNAKGAKISFLVSLVISLWINVGSVIEANPVQPQLPISVGKCEGTYMAVMKMESFTPPTPIEWLQPEGFSIFQISYVWYTAISVLIAVVVGIPAGYLTGFNDPRKMNPKLIARPFDFICWWLPEETRDRLAFNVGKDDVANDLLMQGSAEGIHSIEHVPPVSDDQAATTAFEVQDERFQGPWVRL